jgi:carbonic anhydrase
MPDDELKSLLNNNAAWAARIKKEDPDFFEKLSRQQSPEYLWIGCSDSRVPANQIVGLLPGEVFVHRNIANLVLHSDLNCLSVIQFAVDVLKVRHVIVCGHYGCSGIHAAIDEHTKLGLADNWLMNIQESYRRRRAQFAGVPKDKHWSLLCELNVLDQVRSVGLTTIVQDAWARGQEINIYGWIYGIKDGLIRQLTGGIHSTADLDAKCDHAVREIITVRGGKAG